MNYLLGSTAAFLCDYAAKEKVEKTYDEKKQKELFHGKVQIEKYHNRGAALNALAKSDKKERRSRLTLCLKPFTNKKKMEIQKQCKKSELNILQIK